MEKTKVSEGKTVQPDIKYRESFKRMVVKEHEKGLSIKDQLQQEYGISGNSRVLDWCRKYGKLHYPQKGQQIGRPMKDPQKQRIKELEQRLKEPELKALAYEQLIAITEKEEGISILKKDKAKQLMRLHKPTSGK